MKRVTICQSGEQSLGQAAVTPQREGPGASGAGGGTEWGYRDGAFRSLVNDGRN